MALEPKDIRLDTITAVKVTNPNVAGEATIGFITSHTPGAKTFYLYKSNMAYTLAAGDSVTFKTETSEAAAYYMSLESTLGLTVARIPA